MSFLVRKIDQGKWLQNDILRGSDVSADAITICMKTKENILSAWEITSESNIEDAVLAIVSSGDHLETIDVVIMDRGYLIDQGISHVQKEGLTPIDDLRETHYDFINLTYPKLGVIAYHIVESFKCNRVKRYTEANLRQIMKEAIKANRLDPSRLSDSIARNLQ